MKRNDMSRREFAEAALAVAGAVLCPCALMANPQKPGAPFKSNGPKPGAPHSQQKSTAKSYVQVSAVCCGTCQHWKGERELERTGKRVICQSGLPATPCFRGTGFKYTAISPAKSHGCVDKKFYKRWTSLPD